MSIIESDIVTNAKEIAYLKGLISEVMKRHTEINATVEDIKTSHYRILNDINRLSEKISEFNEKIMLDEGELDIE